MDAVLGKQDSLVQQAESPSHTGGRPVRSTASQ
jgi:hypothetical protein